MIKTQCQDRAIVYPVGKQMVFASFIRRVGSNPMLHSLNDPSFQQNSPEHLHFLVILVRYGLVNLSN